MCFIILTARVMPIAPEFERERQELSAVLTSGAFARSANLANLLAYVCRQYFAGAGDQLKEYNLAVEALGRSQDFDNKKDSVVRVEVHRLRKRLQEYYESEGANHPVQITIPPGQYIPKFVYLDQLELSAVGRDQTPISVAIEPLSLEPIARPVAAPAVVPRPQTRRLWLVLAGCVIALVGGLGLYAYLRPNAALAVAPKVLPADIAGAPGEAVRILAGASHPYLDSNGRTWLPDRYFTGGNTFDDSQHSIFGTRDPQMFRTRREGVFRYDIPLPPGVYEMRLYFAEMLYGESNIANGGEATRVFAVHANGTTLVDDLDVIADSGPSTADIRVFKDIRPDRDGKLHLEFPGVTNAPFLNGIELTPGIPGKLRTIRLVARDHAYTDRQGNVWEPDRYAKGGQLVKRDRVVTSIQDPEVYRGERFGNISYTIPVAKGRYCLKLHFAETWFGPDKPGHGGTGDRVFDVHCNGTMLLRNFDLYKEAGGGDRELVKVFHNIEPTAQGQIQLHLTPRRNYACINAIEVIDESR